TPIPEIPVREETPCLACESTTVEPAATRLRSIDIDASLANWDKEWEPDGVELRIRPYSLENDLVPIDGLVTGRLYGRRLAMTEQLESRWMYGFTTDGSSPRVYAAPRRDQNYLEVARWTVRLKRDGAWLNGHVVRLPFRRISPEYDLTLTTDGEVHARISVK